MSLLHDAATPRSLVHCVNWDIEDTPECCGSAMLLRLDACYVSPQTQKQNAARLIELDWATKSLSDSFTFYHHIKEQCAEQGFAVPRYVAFGAVLEEMIDTWGGSMLWLATDNIGLYGDMHKGPFSTREFCKWLARQPFATVKQGVVRDKGATVISTWSWVLDLTKTREYVRRTKEKYKKLFNKVADQLPDDEEGHTRW